MVLLTFTVMSVGVGVGAGVCVGGVGPGRGSEEGRCCAGSCITPMTRENVTLKPAHSRS